LVSCQQEPVTGVSEAEGLRKPSVSRILRLALLTPDIVEGILAGAESRLRNRRYDKPPS
jgi:hypothetical protein